MSFTFRDRANFSTLASVLCFSRQAENKATDDSAKEPEERLALQRPYPHRSHHKDPPRRVGQ
jgi:hypothetical protein